MTIYWEEYQCGGGGDNGRRCLKSGAGSALYILMLGAPDLEQKYVEGGPEGI
jgi:hypothetical protein